MKAQKGSVLIMAAVLVFVLSFSIIGLLFSIEQSAKVIRVKEVKRIRGYYASIAGLRYARLVLVSPAALGFTPLGDPGDPALPETYTVTGTELGGNFYNDIGVDPADLTITITEINAGPNQGKCAVKAVYK